ncbi:hypothetical protein ACJX0J_008104 [Zea mays]
MPWHEGGGGGGCLQTHEREKLLAKYAGLSLDKESRLKILIRCFNPFIYSPSVFLMLTDAHPSINYELMEKKMPDLTGNWKIKEKKKNTKFSMYRLLRGLYDINKIIFGAHTFKSEQVLCSHFGILYFASPVNRVVEYMAIKKKKEGHFRTWFYIYFSFFYANLLKNNNV